MLFPYRKNEQEDLTTDQLKLLRGIANVKSFMKNRVEGMRSEVKGLEETGKVKDNRGV